MGIRWNFLAHEDDQAPELLIVSTLTLIALVTRAYGIWEWPFTGDEYFTVTYAEERATGMIIGPAYYALVLVSQDIFGVTNWAARLPSVIMGVLSVPAFYFMCRAIFDRRVAAIGCIFVILSEWHLYHSQLARFYSGIFLFGSISYHAYYVGLRNNSYKYLFIFFASAIVAILFHATAVLIIVSCGLFSLLHLIGTGYYEASLSKRVAKAHLLVCIVMAIVATPKFLEVAGWWLANPRGETSNALRTVLGVVENVGVVVFVGAFLGVVYLGFKNLEKFYLLAILLVIPLLLVSLFSVILPPSRPRYMFYALPLFFGLTAFFCGSIDSDLRKYAGVDVGIILIISAVMFVSFASYYSGKLSLDARDPASFVNKNFEMGDKVVVFEYPIRDYFKDSLKVNKITMQAWRGGLTPVVETKGRTWIIFKTYRTSSLRQDMEAWLMENASLKWRKEEYRFDYTQRGYEIWLEAGN